MKENQTEWENYLFYFFKIEKYIKENWTVPAKYFC